MNPKVMLGTVTYKGKDYCRDEFTSNRANLDYDNYTIKEVWTDDHYGNTRVKISYGYNELLQLFLASDCDYLLTLEADIIPPKHIIKTLLSHDKDIVGAVYQIGPKKNRYPCAFTGRKFNIRNNAGSVVGKGTQSFEWTHIDGTLKQSPGGCGLGCVLIKRKVFSKISKFRHTSVHCDMWFHRDAQDEGFETWVDTSIICKHHGSFEEWQPLIAKGEF